MSHRSVAAHPPRCAEDSARADCLHTASCGARPVPAATYGRSLAASHSATRCFRALDHSRYGLEREPTVRWPPLVLPINGIVDSCVCGGRSEVISKTSKMSASDSSALSESMEYCRIANPSYVDIVPALNVMADWRMRAGVNRSSRWRSKFRQGRATLSLLSSASRSSSCRSRSSASLPCHNVLYLLR